MLEPLEPGDVEAAAHAFAGAGVEAVAVCFLFSFAHPEHEREARTHPRIDASRRAGLPVVRGRRGAPGVPARRDNRAQRRAPARRGLLRRGAGRTPPVAGRRRAAAPDALERRARHGRSRTPAAGRADRVRPGCRRDRRGPPRRRRRDARPADLRHGRHHGGRLSRVERRARAALSRRGAGPPGHAAADRRPVGRGGGRLDRARGCLRLPSRRARERGRRSRSGRLRTWWRGRHGVGRAPRPRHARSRPLPGRPHGARRRRRPPRRGAGGREAAPAIARRGR